MKVCQITIAFLLVLGFLQMLHQDINGKAARPPRGFGGVVGTLIIFILYLIVFWKAGAFSLLP